jgi:hypothetical protein
VLQVYVEREDGQPTDEVDSEASTYKGMLMPQETWRALRDHSVTLIVTKYSTPSSPVPENILQRKIGL